MSRRSNPRRPPKQWMRDCVAGASESAADPGAVCGALWYRKMSPAAKRAALARERRDNPTRAEHYRAASQAAVKAEKVIAAARRARGAERGRLLDEAEVLVRESVEHGRAAGDTWMSYETSSGREEIEKLRGRRANPAWAKVFG